MTDTLFPLPALPAPLPAAATVLAFPHDRCRPAPAVETAGSALPAATVLDLAQWRSRLRPEAVLPALSPLAGRRIRRFPTLPDAELPDYVQELNTGIDRSFPAAGTPVVVISAWEEAVAPLSERDRRVAAAVFLAEMRSTGIRLETAGENAYRHLVARLLYRDELIWRRNHGAFHAFARSLLIRFAMALSRQGVA